MPAQQRGPDFGNGKKEDPVFAEESMSNAELARQLRDVQNQLAVTKAGMPLTLVPYHGAGPGTEVSETWSAVEQAEAKALEEAGVEPGPTGK